MKKIFKLVSLALAVLLLIPACKKEAVDTAQYRSEFAFAAFSPNPIYRGGELTILGSYLENTAKVVIPGIDPLTNITVVESGEKSRITVTLPNTTEEVGKIQIVSKDGKVLTSLAELTSPNPSSSPISLPSPPCPVT